MIYRFFFTSQVVVWDFFHQRYHEQSLELTIFWDVFDTDVQNKTPKVPCVKIGSKKQNDLRPPYQQIIIIFLIYIYTYNIYIKTIICKLIFWRAALSEEEKLSFLERLMFHRWPFLFQEKQQKTPWPTATRACLKYTSRLNYVYWWNDAWMMVWCSGGPVGVDAVGHSLHDGMMVFFPVVVKMLMMVVVCVCVSKVTWLLCAVWFFLCCFLDGNQEFRRKTARFCCA